MAEGEYKNKILELASQPLNQYALDWLYKVNLYKKKVIFGAGGGGKQWLGVLESYNIKPDHFCDNNHDLWGKKIKGIVCISPDELLKIEEDIVVIVAGRKYQEIQKQLLAIGIKSNDIMIADVDTLSFKANYMISTGEVSVDDLCKAAFSVADICEDELSAKILYQTLKRYMLNRDEAIDYTGEAYFIPEIGKREHETFVDVGAFDGDTLNNFLKVYHNSFDKYYAFELDRVNYENLCNKIAQMPDEIKKKISVYNIGLWSEKVEIHYDSNKEATNVTLNGECIGFVNRLDDLLNEEVTFIKMDIEGAEIEALKGCIEHIHKYKPICAICIYHSISDLIKIPMMLKELGYRIIIRHHDIDASEIVCYAYE